jgi:hypothetical protein
MPTVSPFYEHIWPWQAESYKQEVCFLIGRYGTKHLSPLQRLMPVQNLSCAAELGSTGDGVLSGHWRL